VQDSSRVRGEGAGCSGGEAHFLEGPGEHRVGDSGW
jgi:hypothetical protein